MSDRLFGFRPPSTLLFLISFPAGKIPSKKVASPFFFLFWRRRLPVSSELPSWSLVV